jgi:hypothetical protein
MLTRDDFLTAPVLQRELVEVPRLGKQVYVREMTHQEFAEWVVATGQAKAPEEREYDPLYGPKLLAKCLVDETGGRIFEDGDAEALGRLPTAVLGPLVDVAQRLNGFSPAQLKETVKN